MTEPIFQQARSNDLNSATQVAIDMDGPLPEKLEDYWTIFLGNHSLDGLFAHPVLFPLQRRREMELMHKEAAKIKARVIMETGADKGGGIYGWTTIPTVKNIIACEIRGTPYGDAFDNRFPGTDFLWLPQSSYHPETVTTVARWLNLDGSKIDCLFIDGDKSYFTNDLNCYLPFMSPNGIVFMHDIVDSAPGDSFREAISRGYGYKIIQDKSESFEAMDRARRNDPILSCYEGWLRHWKGASCNVGVIYLNPNKKGLQP